MDRMTDRSAIFETMRDLVADSLAIQPEDVKLGSRLTAELGADSLDFIDMIFTLEKRFGVKMREGELNFISKLDFSSPAVMKDGALTAETVERLRAWLPALDALPEPRRVTPKQLFSLISVETLCIMVERKLAESGAAAGAT